MKRKIVLISVLLFLLINGVTYVITKLNEKQRVQLVLDKNIQTLQVHYEILLNTQRMISQSMYQSTVASEKFIEIMTEAKSASEQRRDELRVELQMFLAKKYEIAKLKGVLQYHFIFPDNRVFLRMHKPEKYGDDLTNIRDDFRYTNRTKKPIRGFTQGRTAHGFRNVFPIFGKNSEHIGAMEISFSSDSFQYSLNNISHIHTHFLVDKQIFDAKTWARDDLIVRYSQSAEAIGYMMTLGTLHTKKRCIDENIIKLAPIREKINKSIKSQKKFAVYVEHNSDVDVVSFLPIRNLKGKAIAWLVAYEKSTFIEMTLKGGFVIRLIAFFVSVIIIYLIILQTRARVFLLQRHKLLNDILNATDNIVFITDFKTISFSNDRFNNLLNIKDTKDFNNNSSNGVFNIFNKTDGYLHSDLCKKNESFISLILRTPEDERVVSILDRHLESKAFTISISKTNSINDYLVTLSDITKIKAMHDVTKKKAYFDGLTNVYNRNKFDEILEIELNSSKRYGNCLSIAIIDIDKFKEFNDTFGHLVGDEVLVMMAQSVNNNVRTTDIFARWGGEEFVILFKNTSLKDATIVSEKLKDVIQQLSHPTAGGITASFGLTSYIEGDTIDTIFKRCDEALYIAKENGRNRVEVL